MKKPKLSPEKAGVLRVINASQDFGIAVAELALRIRSAGIQLSDAAAFSAANALCDLDLVKLGGEPPKYFGKDFRP